jgi:O-antigen/teichoic acid export membrane protein
VFVMLPINASFTPHIAHLHHIGETRELARMYAAATSWIVRLSLPAFVALIVFPHDLLRIFGHGFAAGASVTVILAVGQLVRAATGPCGTLLNMSGRVAVNMADNVGVLALNIVLNLILIPPYGYIAASWTTVATEVVLVAAGWWLTARHLGKLHLAAASWRPILAGAVMGAVIYPLSNVHGEAVLLVVLLGIAVYVAALVLLRAMTREEIQFLRAALKRPS